MPRALSSLALGLALLGCRGGEAPPSAQLPQTTSPPAPRSDVTVTEISLGRALEPDRRIARPVDVFAPTDTVYVSVVTQGSAAEGLLKARWTYQNAEVVAESSLYIVPSSMTGNEFHISKAEGLPRGTYEVEITLDGRAAGKRSFSVR
jgi:hypothetical protein